MNNIPDLGDFGYIPSPSSGKGINWLSIIVLAAFGVVTILLVRKLLESFISDSEYTCQISDALKKIDQSNENSE